MRQPNSQTKRQYVLRARAEALARTRGRIIEATCDLHREVGPAATTVAEIARRAGVQRMTVYNHFTEEAELFSACQDLWLSRHPFPDPAPLLAHADPEVRTRSVLQAVYGWYRETADMAEKVQRDRGAVPALDELLRATADASRAALADALVAGFRDRGRRRERRRALIAVALEFWTWRRLQQEGLDVPAAAELMTRAAAAA